MKRNCTKSAWLRCGCARAAWLLHGVLSGSVLGGWHLLLPLEVLLLLLLLNVTASCAIMQDVRCACAFVLILLLAWLVAIVAACLLRV